MLTSLAASINTSCMIDEAELAFLVMEHKRLLDRCNELLTRIETEYGIADSRKITRTAKSYPLPGPEVADCEPIAESGYPAAVAAALNASRKERDGK